MIELRDLRADDRDRLLEWRNSPGVAKNMYSDHVISMDEHVLWFERALRDERSRYWIIELDGEPVGLANVVDIDHENSRCSWAFYLASPNVRGRGVGSFVEYRVLRYVFDELRLNKLSCEVLAFNEAVIQMHRGFGFTVEGTLREHRRKEGAFVDVVCLGMLAKEWASLREPLAEKLRAKGVLA